MEQRGVVSTAGAAYFLPENAEGLRLDGESWKNKDSTTYTSILDLYGVSDLFSQEMGQRYEKMQMEEQALQEELREYVFSGALRQEKLDGELIDYIFSEPMSLSKVKEYTTEKETDALCLFLAAVLAGLLFGRMIFRYNRERKKRRENFAVEIDMEDIRAE